MRNRVRLLVRRAPAARVLLYRRVNLLEYPEVCLARADYALPIDVE